MNSPTLAAILSSLVSQLTLLILLLYPSSPFSIDSLPNSHHFEPLFTLIQHFLSSPEIVALLSPPRKRRRTHFSPPETHQGTDFKDPKLDPIVQLDRVDSVLVKHPDSFRVLFRMEPSTFEWLCGLLEPLLECRDPVGFELNLSADLRLGIGLYRLATGSDYPEIATRFRVTERVAKFCSKQLCRVLCTNFRFWVEFPNPDEFDSVSKKFEELSGLPNCCGVIGCTRFNIINGEESIAAQIVVDSSFRILSIFVGFGGDKSNSVVLKSSTLYEDILGGKLLNSPPIEVEGVSVPQYLVGECGYPLLPWLLVGFDDPKSGSNEERFNGVVGLMQSSMAKTVNSLKGWGILSKTLNEEFRNGVAYIGACAILHNALLLRGDYSGLCDEIEDSMVHDQRMQHSRARSNIEEHSIEGGVIRSALATKARNLI